VEINIPIEELTGLHNKWDPKLKPDTLTYKKESVTLYDAAFKFKMGITKVVDYPLYFRM
jgi:hypothetical protein